MYKATIILDSVNRYYYNSRITTFEISAPRFLLAEINTHRILAKSAASSRAIPVKKRIEMIRQSPFIPEAFGKNRPGMQAEETLSDEYNTKAKISWQKAIDCAITCAEELQELDVHKQQANRILEPFCFFMGVITATEWENFYNLRLHPDAQPEFQKLARMMKEAQDNSVPIVRDIHLPYNDETNEISISDAFYVSAARCARVSYKTFDGKLSTVNKDLELCEQLLNSGHMSPFDHQAIADSIYYQDDKKFWKEPKDHRQFYGWIPKRVLVEKELGYMQPRSSFDSIPNYN